jgi:hypothetical protein
MTSEVLVDKSFDPMTPAFRVMALFKFLMQYIVRALRVHSPEKELREILIEIIDEELSEPHHDSRPKCSVCGKLATNGVGQTDPTKPNVAELTSFCEEHRPCKKCGHKKSEHVAGSGFCRNEKPGAFAGTTLCTCNGFQS